MTDLNVLWLTHKGEGYVGAPSTQHGFEQEVSKLCNCRFAGEGWEEYATGETMHDTVKRVMPEADWVIDSDNNLHNHKPRGRGYRVGHFVSDIHAKHFYGTSSPITYAQLINEAGYDAVFMRYKLLYGTKHRPDAMWDWIKCEKHWLPWSVDDNYYKPKHKQIDVAFIGSRGNCYPLRNDMWEGLYYVCRGYKVVREEAPKGKTYERTIDGLKTTHLVGDKYRDTLSETRILAFGCSVYRYPLQKFFEGAASKCLIASNEPGNAKELGFVDEKTYVEVDEATWEDKLLWLLENPGTVSNISRGGMKNVLMRHTHKVRSQEFVEALQR